MKMARLNFYSVKIWRELFQNLMIDLLKLFMCHLAILKRQAIYSWKREQSMWFALKVVKRYQIRLQFYSLKYFMKRCLQWITSIVFAKHFLRQKNRFDFNVQKVRLINSYVDILSLKRIISVSHFRILNKVCLKNLIQSHFLIILQVKLINSLVVNRKCMMFALGLINIDLWVF